MDDITFLTRSEHRGPTLIALTVRPSSRSVLWEMAGVSESTIRRTLGEFEDRDWVDRDGYQYEATELGAFVASAMADLIDSVETERKLRDVWRLLPDEHTGFTIEMCSDATVTVADPEDPARPATRFCSLLEETDELRFVGIDVAMLDSCENELRDRIVDGMETEFISPRRLTNYIRSNWPDLLSEAPDSARRRRLGPVRSPLTERSSEAPADRAAPEPAADRAEIGRNAQVIDRSLPTTSLGSWPITVGNVMPSWACSSAVS